MREGGKEDARSGGERWALTRYLREKDPLGAAAVSAELFWMTRGRLPRPWRGIVAAQVNGGEGREGVGCRE
jgi:hypothetical protein